MTNAELIAKIKAEIERRIKDNTFGPKSLTYESKRFEEIPRRTSCRCR